MADTVSDRRNNPRLEVKELVLLDVPDHPLFMLDVSESGMAIQAMEILQTGKSFYFALTLPNNGPELKGKATVVWSDRSGRAGVNFTDLSVSDRLHVRQWLARYADVCLTVAETTNDRQGLQFLRGRSR